MKKYHIRYNTKHGESDLVWRVFENGEEHLVRNVFIDSPSRGEPTMEDGIQKWNIVTEGTMSIIDNIAYIK